MRLEIFTLGDTKTGSMDEEAMTGMKDAQSTWDRFIRVDVVMHIRGVKPVDYYTKGNETVNTHIF